MKARKLLPVLLSVTASAFVLSGCSDWNNDWTAAELQYAKNFEQTFGRIDPNQDWNLVAQIANSNNVVTRAAGNKTTPTGEFKITVLPESQAAPLTAEKMKAYSKMLPEIGGSGGTSYDDSNLGRVTQNFSVTTNKVVLYPVYWWTDATDEVGLYYYSDESGSVQVRDNAGNTHSIVKVPITSSHPEELEYYYSSEDVFQDYESGNIYADASTHILNNWDDLVLYNDTKYIISDGSQVDFYGNVYGSGIKLVCVGTKQYDSTVPAYKRADNCDAQFVWEDLSAVNNSFRISGGKYQILTSKGGDHWESVLSFLQTFNSNDPMKVDPAIEAATSETPLNGRLPLKFRSKGIVVDLPANMKIGFYIQNGSAIMYSEGKLNEKMPWAGHTTEDQCYVATYESGEVDANNNPVRYLAFEDWNRSGDFDLNDIVFRVYGLNDIHDEEDIKSEEGLFVCEDLGAFDFDFNDVVLKAKWRRYYKKHYTTDANGVVTNVTIEQDPSDDLTITAMAAGGANPSDVYFKTKTNTDGYKIGEIHELLYGEAPSIINAGKKYGTDGKSKTFGESEFLETWDESDYPNGYVSQMFGEGLLYIIASTKNGVEQGGAYNEKATRIISGNNYKTIGVPQVMLMPTTYEWCQESQPINEVYPKFTQWVEDATVIDWFVEGQGKVESRTTDRGVTAVAINNTPASPSDVPVTPPVTPPAPDYGTKIAFTQSTQILLPLVEESTTKVIFNVVVTNGWASMIMKDGSGTSGTKLITAEGDEWNARQFHGNGVHTIEITNPDHITLIRNNGIWIEGYMTGNAELYYKVQ